MVVDSRVGCPSVLDTPASLARGSGISGTMPLSPQCFSPSLSPPAVGMALSFSSLCGLPLAGCGGLWSSSPLVLSFFSAEPVADSTFSLAASSVEPEVESLLLSVAASDDVEPNPPPAAEFPLPSPVADAALAAAPVTPAPLPLPHVVSSTFLPSVVVPNCPVSLAFPPVLPMPRYDLTVSIMPPLWELVCCAPLPSGLRGLTKLEELTPPLSAPVPTPPSVPREVSSVPGGAVLEAMCCTPSAC